jgi:hypothetical protein
VDTVLAYRLKYLGRYTAVPVHPSFARCDKEESQEKYLQYMKEVEVDWDR